MTALDDDDERQWHDIRRAMEAKCVRVTHSWATKKTSTVNSWRCGEKYPSVFQYRNVFRHFDVQFTDVIWGNLNLLSDEAMRYVLCYCSMEIRRTKNDDAVSYRRRRVSNVRKETC